MSRKALRGHVQARRRTTFCLAESTEILVIRKFNPMGHAGSGTGSEGQDINEREMPREHSDKTTSMVGILSYRACLFLCPPGPHLAARRALR